MRLRLDPLAPNGITIDKPEKIIQSAPGYVQRDVTGLIQPGSNITMSGQGTSSSPLVINSSGGGSSLPTDATGWLHDNGSGTLAWTTPVKSDVGLGNVDNTSDATKNSATAALTNKDLTSGTNTFPTLNQNTTGTASTITGSITESQVTSLTTDLAAKQATLVSGTNIKTVGGTSLLGSGDVTVSGGQTLFDCVVAASGGDYTTVTAAITAGKTAIFVRAGTYTETGFSSGAPNATDSITITGADPKTTVLSFGTNSFTLNGANITIQNISLSTSTGTVSLGGNYTTLHNVWQLSSNSTNYALQLGFVAQVSNYRFIDSASAGSGTYRINSGSSNTFTNCYFFITRNGSNAFLSLGIQSTISNSIWYLNSGAQGGAYMVSVGTKGVVSGCNFTNQGATDGCIQLNGVGAAAIGNSMDAGAPGIQLMNTANGCLVTGNMLYWAGSGSTAINCAGATNVISGNLIRHRSTTGSTALGIVVAASKNNNTITGNVVTNAFVGLTINTGATNTVVTGNTFTANGTNLTDSGTTTVNTGNVTT